MIRSQDCQLADERAAAVIHRDGEFNQFQLDVYAEIEPRHFWFHGRRRFLRYALERQLKRSSSAELPSAIDLGGGAGGWLWYLRQEVPEAFSELALGDSSPRALELATSLLGPDVPLFQVDLLSLPWRRRWDIVFLLDVIEHMRDDVQAMTQISLALRPGGLLFVTAPAIRWFWTSNDNLERHARRYSRHDFQKIADKCGLELIDARYFMFLLSPLLLLSRWFGPNLSRMTSEQMAAHYRKTHGVPPRPLNAVLRAIFNLETPLGHRIAFPWGTSVFGLFRKP